MDRWWADRRFLCLWWCQVLGQVGDHLVSLSLTVVVYRVFGTGAALGTYFVARSLPSMVVGPVAGVCADTYNRRPLAIFAYGISFAVALVLPYAGTTARMVVAAFLGATATALAYPALQAALPQVVAQDRLLAANSIISATGSIARFVAPSVSALVVGLAGTSAAFLAAATSYLLAALSLLPLRLPNPRGDRGGTPLTVPHAWRDLLEGLTHLVRTKALLAVALVTSLVMFADSAVHPIFTILVKRVLGMPPESIGYLSSAFGAGTLLGAGVLPVLKRRFDEQGLLSAGVFAIAAQMLAYSQITEFWFALPLQVASGIGFAFLLNATRTLFQTLAPGALVGRVVAASMALSSFLNLFAVKGGGFMADRLGPRAVFLCAGILCLACGAASLPVLRPRKEHR
ncbi:MAG: MFS transporter [Bacillota bacterium]